MVLKISKQCGLITFIVNPQVSNLGLHDEESYETIMSYLCV